ncbi:TetR/AcrR family transcriptional regulator [Allostreptomyces psammosilenae]|uniref:AcrR family transcriptional regulator n=1 Tax=Allostreptomyces psammosilenae TaxID=1892865 RepID=A0A852ZU56_9ACTN|nr:TetR family transcriptional regulator [Allostreptomyces psammosilenae]NYI04820.1 AcrR family transcriptional regulator [Allostreptomyces psammosilenae]
MRFTERSEGTRTAILRAARRQFAERGHESTTIRSVAAEAGVDPSMVMRYYGNKAGLFDAAIDVDLRLPEPAGQDRAHVGRTLAEHFVNRWEGELADLAITLLLRTAATHPASAERVREVFDKQVLAMVSTLTGGGPETGRRAAMVSAQLLGVALTRYVLRLGPIAAMDSTTLVGTLAPVLQHYLTGELDTEHLDGEEADR